MKKDLGRLFLALMLWPLLAGCGPAAVTVDSSAGNGGPAGNGSTGPVIKAFISRSGGFGSYSDYFEIYVYAYDGQDLTITSATLIPPGGVPVALTCNSIYQNDFAVSSGWTYQAGQTYGMQVSIQGWGTFTASISAVPGGISYPAAGTPGPITWTFPGGANDEVDISSSVSRQVLMPATSGALTTDSTTYFPSAGSYMVLVMLREGLANPFGSVANPASFLSASCIEDFAVTR